MLGIIIYHLLFHHQLYISTYTHHMVIHRPSCRDQRLHLCRDVDHVDRGAAVEELRGEGQKAGRRRGAAASAPASDGHVSRQKGEEHDGKRKKIWKK